MMAWLQGMVGLREGSFKLGVSVYANRKGTSVIRG